MTLKEQVDTTRLPRHIAIIMDGNGRWAKQQGKNRVFGHRQGVTAVREATEAAAEIGVEYLTLYAFSLENWQRPKLEVSALMELLVQTTRKEVETLMKNDIRLAAIGNLDMLPKRTRNMLLEAIDISKNNKRMQLTLALSYGSRWEIAQAAKQMAQKVKAGEMDPDDINEEILGNHLYTADIPDPELLIRTSGEKRISNFLLWQIAYAELYFSDLFWPEFRKEEFYRALIDYQRRERRFGKISEQIKV